MRKYYTSGVMRLCSRLLITLRRNRVKPPSGVSMSDYLAPAYFNAIARATLTVALQDDMDEENLAAPSNALKLSYDIKRLCDIKVGFAIKTGNKVLREEANDFLTLMKIEWSTKLERELLEERKAEKKRPMPLPSDVEKLASYYKREAEDINLEEASYDNYRRVCIIALSCLIVYNRHRPGGVQAMKFTTYNNRIQGIDQVTEEISDLTNLEKRLVQDQDVIQLRGKGNKYVPVIMPSYAKPLLKYLADKDVRKEAGIQRKNKYVFANQKTGVIRGGFAVTKTSEGAGLQEPLRITTSNMRRYMATMCQLMDITPQQQRWIVDHLGHTLDVHNLHYRATLDVIERVDIAKLLLAMDMNKLSLLKGRQIADIDLKEILEPDVVNTEDGPDAVNKDVQEQHEGVEEEHDELQDYVEEEEYVPDLPSLEEDNEEEQCEIFDAQLQTKKKKKKSFKRHVWTKDEIKEVRHFFRKFFDEDKTPGELAVAAAMRKSEENCGTMWKIPLKSIKSKISYMRSHHPK